MSNQITNYRIFIASPGGLDDERKAFKDTIANYSDSEAIPRGALFSPIGWEITLRGIGRAQEMINEEVRTCDFFVLLLWDRWGTPTGSPSNHTSGTEEEYEIAWECYRTSKRPMREIIVFFKAVTPRQLSDPGEQLEKVLDFKTKLEAEKKLFFDTFDNVAAFQEKLRRYLAQWLRLHESGVSGKVKRPSLDFLRTQPSPPKDFLAVDSKQAPSGLRGKKGDLTRKAEQLAKQKKLTEAEALFTQAISRFDDPLAFRSYSEFLIEQGRWVQAEAITTELAKLASTLNTPTWGAYAHVKLGAICMAQGKIQAAIEHLRIALMINEKVGAPIHLARNLFSLGFAYFKAGEFLEAEKLWKRSLDYDLGMAKWGDAGRIAKMLAQTASKLKNKKKALEYLVQAKELFEKAGAGKRVKEVQSDIDQISKGGSPDLGDDSISKPKE
jgi:tetratricopeptide (TPR) repeat protein